MRDRADLRAGVRLRSHVRPSGRSSTAAATRPMPAAPDRRSGCRPISSSGIEVNRVRARHTLRPPARRPTPRWPGVRGSLGRRRRRGATRAHRRHGAFLAALARPRTPVRGPSLAGGDPALGAGHQGADLHADGSDGRGADHLAARDSRAASATGTTATRGCATRRSRSRRSTSSGLDWEADEFMQFVADLEPNSDGGLQIMYGIDGRRDLTETFREDLSGYAGASPVRIGNGAFDQRQNDVFGAVLDSILKHTSAQPAPTPAPVADRAGAGRVRHQRLAPARPGHLGGARQAAALRVLEADVLGGHGSRGQAGPHPRQSTSCGQVGGHRGGDPCRHPRARADQGRRAAPALRHRRARCLDAAGGDVRLPPRQATSGCTTRCWRSPTS